MAEVASTLGSLSLTQEMARRLREQVPVALVLCDKSEVERVVEDNARLRAENLRLKAALAQASPDDEVRW